MAPHGLIDAEDRPQVAVREANLSAHRHGALIEAGKMDQPRDSIGRPDVEAGILRAGRLDLLDPVLGRLQRMCDVACILGRDHGFVAGVVPGRLVLPSAEEGAPPVLTLTFDSQAAFADDPNRAAVRDVMLSFDVPQTDPKAAPFVA